MRLADAKRTIKLLGLEKVTYGIKNIRTLDGSKTVQFEERELLEFVVDMVRSGYKKYGSCYRFNAIMKHKDGCYSVYYNDYQGICKLEKIDDISKMQKVTQMMKRQCYILLVEQNNGLYELAV